ncbi:ABC transporter ATP-binding protein [Niallia taxi]|uniref:ABC transporter ATP-binding protein n=1 Tax=Niallia taxi TaxID=2499688 RepID=UPI001248FBB0|nr:ABC transporter ATP-binding protein [Niallia taxi]MCM3215897.1 ABC transporter ATP-binding protein [Niallia taxi]MDK8639053.1 ABC transporter ATP-binding protein [Niallia taxi]
MTVLKSEELQFRQGKFQLHDINIEFPEGKMTAIVGPNGSGKSTLLKLFARLLKADNGLVTLDNQPIHKYKRKEYSQKIAMLPQAKEVLPSITVKELVGYGRVPFQRLTGPVSEEDKEIIAWAIRETGLENMADRMVGHLSGGELQRARIAMALAQKTSVLLLDEPTTFLDITHQLELMKILSRINKTYQITVIMVLHELQYAGAYSDNLIVMKRGEIYQTGKPQAILTAQLLKEVYEIDASIKFENNYPVIIPKN